MDLYPLFSRLPRSFRPRRIARNLLDLADLQVSRRGFTESLNLHLRWVLSALKINCVVDVGAHQGHFGAKVRDLGFDGHILSFEPVESNFKVLARAASRDPKWRTFNVALGDRDGVGEINIYRHSTFHSMLRPTEFGRETFGVALDIESTRSIAIARIDSIFNPCIEGVASPRIYLKLDTQGYDLAVLAGASSMLELVLGLQAEVTLKPIYANMDTTLLRMVPELKQKGFALSGLFPVSRGGHCGLEIIELDCVAIRNKFWSGNGLDCQAKAGRTHTLDRR